MKYQRENAPLLDVFANMPKDVTNLLHHFKNLLKEEYLTLDRASGRDEYYRVTAKGVKYLHENTPARPPQPNNAQRILEVFLKYERENAPLLDIFANMPKDVTNLLPDFKNLLKEGYLTLERASGRDEYYRVTPEGKKYVNERPSK